MYNYYTYLKQKQTQDKLETEIQKEKERQTLKQSTLHIINNILSRKAC